MKIRQLLVAFIYSLLFTDNDGSYSSFTSFLQISRNSICRKNDICRTKPQVMRYVLNGLILALRECQNQFKNGRWNCTEKNGSIEKIMQDDSRESAFLKAINAAGVTHVVTRACSLGDLHLCQCDAFKYREGMTTASQRIANKQVAERFADNGVCDENIDYGENISRDVFAVSEVLVARTILVRRNYEAGRKALRKLTKKTCKCFGYSGTCTQKACWLVLPSFNRVGLDLKKRFDSASLVSFNNKGTEIIFDEKIKPPTDEDLLYTSAIVPRKFCDPNPSVGSFGTKGRQCNVRSGGTDGCGIMCCDRGAEAKEEQSETSCDCVFHWCCSVKCETCKIKRIVYRCNGANSSVGQDDGRS